MNISRKAYAGLYGPTTGDRVRLGDTDLLLEVEVDRTVYGEEVVFGGRQGHPRRAGAVPALPGPTAAPTW